MSLKGGYKIIDLKGFDVTSAAMMIEGIYESIESNYGKPLLISGIVIDGIEKDDVFVQATLNGTTYVFNLYGYTIQVQDTDVVCAKETTTIDTYTDNVLYQIKEGDTYVFRDFTDVSYTIDLHIYNIKGISYSNAVNKNISLHDIFIAFDLYSENNMLQCECSLNTDVAMTLWFSVVNGILFISQIGTY